MTKFERSKFQYHGGYLTYGDDRRFVARFKHVPSNRPKFVSFLIKNFTVEEYFSLLETPSPECFGNCYAPQEILEMKGYVAAHIMKWLKDGIKTEWKGHGYDYWKQFN